MKKKLILIFSCTLMLALPLIARTVLAGAWQQCGGNTWTGATQCVGGYTCVRVNDNYFQCQPSPQGKVSKQAISRATKAKNSKTSLRKTIS